MTKLLSTSSIVWLTGFTAFCLAGVPWGNFIHPPSPDSWEVHFAVLGGHGMRLAACAWMCVLLAGTGRALLRSFGVRYLSAWEELGLSFGLGYGAWATFMLLLGLAGLWHRPLLLGLMALGTALAAMEARILWKGLSPAVSLRTLLPKTRLSQAASVAFMTGWLIHLWRCLIPVTFYDALNYHLATPGLFLLRHGVVPVPEHSYSGFPAIPWMVNALTLIVDPWGIVAQLLHHAMLVWLGVALLGAARRLGSAEAGPLACAVFGLTPVVASESYRLSVGLELALFQLLCFHAFVSAAAAGPGTSERRGWMILCGTFLGFALSTKYLAWFLPGSLALAALALRWTPPDPQKPYPRFSSGELGILGGVALLWLAPWIAKNLAFYGNPLYPFFHERFAPDAVFKPAWDHISEGGLDLRRTFGTFAGLRRFLLHPVEFSRPSGDFGSGIGPVYLGLTPLLLAVRLNAPGRILALLVIGTWVPLSLVSPITRFYIPCLAGWALLGAHALASLPTGPAQRALRALIAASFLAVGSAFWAMGTPALKNLDVLLGSRRFEDYLSHTNFPAGYSTPPHAGFAYLHEKTPPDAKVMVFGDSRHFPLWRDHIASSLDQPSALEVWANRSADGGELRRRFLQEGVDFILVNHAEIFRNQTAFMFSPHGLRNLEEFWGRYTLKVFQKGANQDYWVVVYRILDEEEAARPHPSDRLFAAYKTDGPATPDK